MSPVALCGKDHHTRDGSLSITDLKVRLPMSLRSKIVKLAQENPAYRGALLPVLREIAKTASMEKAALRKKQMQKLMGQDGTFGVISAYQPGSKKQNKERHGELIRDLQKMGYKPETLRGSWEGVTEQSMFIPNIKPEDLFELGRKYNQDAVIHKSKDGVLGMYHTKGAPRAEIAVDAKGDPAFQSATDKSLYSKSRGLSFEFGFLWGENVPWDGKKPVSRKEMRSFVKGRGKGTEEKSDASREKFEEAVEGKKFQHPDTHNEVLYKSLPSEEQAKVYEQWAGAAD
jgi:hypothetical protein